jgi:hypothetical protein
MRVEYNSQISLVDYRGALSDFAVSILWQHIPTIGLPISDSDLSCVTAASKYQLQAGAC